MRNARFFRKCCFPYARRPLSRDAPRDAAWDAPRDAPQDAPPWMPRGMLPGMHEPPIRPFSPNPERQHEKKMRPVRVKSFFLFFATGTPLALATLIFVRRRGT